MNEHQPLNKRLTLEALIYLAIFLIAALLRFLMLGNLALNDQEAGLALQALKWSAGDAPLLSGEPGYLALTTALFYLLKATEFLARFWPALAGTLVVLLPVFTREALGRRTALILAGLLAIDPILISVSRSAEGSALALVGLFAAIGFWHKNRSVLSGICLGLALLGGPGVWPGAIVLAGVIAAFTIKAKRENPSAMNTIHLPAGPDQVRILLTALVTMFTISTLFLTYPRGFSAIGSSFTEFIGFWLRSDAFSFTGLATAWLLTMLPAVILLIWALTDALIHRDERVKWLAVWAFAALFLALINPSRQLNDLFWVSIPLMAIAAIKLDSLFKDNKIDNLIVFLSETGLTITLVIFSFLNSLNLINSPLLNNDEYRNRVIGMILPLILLIGLTVLLAWGWSEHSTRKGLTTGIVTLLILMLFTGATKAAGFVGEVGFEIRRGGGTPVSTHELLSTIHDLSRSKTGIENRIDIKLVELTMPSIEWVLRDFENTSNVIALNPNADSSILLTPADVEIESNTSYRGQYFRWMVTPDFDQMSFADWMKWWLFRTAPVNDTGIILWARNDLFPGGKTQ